MSVSSCLMLLSGCWRLVVDRDWMLQLSCKGVAWFEALLWSILRGTGWPVVGKPTLVFAWYAWWCGWWGFAFAEEMGQLVEHSEGLGRGAELETSQVWVFWLWYGGEWSAVIFG